MFSKTKPANKASRTVEPVPPLPDLTPPGQKSAPAPAMTPSGRSLSTLAVDLVFEGNVSGPGDLQIDGTVKGDVRAGRLVIGETGVVEGAITADDIQTHGRVSGSIAGKQVKLSSTAHVDGDITHEQLSIDVGAYFQGRCIQARKEAPKPRTAPEAKPSEARAAAVKATA